MRTLLLMDHDGHVEGKVVDTGHGITFSSNKLVRIEWTSARAAATPAGADRLATDHETFDALWEHGHSTQNIRWIRSDEK